MPAEKELKVFLCHSSADSDFVVQVGAYLKRNVEHVFMYEEHQHTEPFGETLARELGACDVMVVFVGETFGHLGWQKTEISRVVEDLNNKRKAWKVFIVPVPGEARHFLKSSPEVLNLLPMQPVICPDERQLAELARPDPQNGRDEANPPGLPQPFYAAWVARQIVSRLERPWRSVDDLPANPHLFDYEKDIIDFYVGKLGIGDKLWGKPEEAGLSEKELKAKRRKLLEGCPPGWPEVEQYSAPPGNETPLDPSDTGPCREHDARVIVAALSKYHRSCIIQDPATNLSEISGCMVRQQLSFPEARPSKNLCFPRGDHLRVAVLVAGGIAPGLNAVIDGVVQRHWRYCEKSQQKGRPYSLTVYGLQNGLRAFDQPVAAPKELAAFNHFTGAKNPPDEAAEHANEGGCILGTSRVKELIEDSTAPAQDIPFQVAGRLTKLAEIVNQLSRWGIDILYMIGGDGTMKAAHALRSIARDRQYDLSVVAIPKTMDNDILWMWQSFGFLSAVEKAREIIENLHTEVKSNPRLCVLQLFGSDSGFVVSHAVLASATGQIDAALIPEVPFSMKQLAMHVKSRMLKRCERIPHGLVVMAETAIPLDAECYCSLQGIHLSDDEKKEIAKFCAMRKNGVRIQGQTEDLLRSAGLKIVRDGLAKLLCEGPNVPDAWRRHLRVMTNEPRHVLRSVRPSCTDIIMGQRLGTLAVDNAMAGFTDFMISQWLTEYVLVPLKLVTLGRKRIPQGGIFWKSVLAKTEQPPEMYDIQDLKQYDPAEYDRCYGVAGG